jgi:hypothetical protein
MRDIGEILRKSEGKKLREFQAALVNIATKYKIIISETPLNMRGAPINTSTTRRKEWLDRNVIDPSNRLIAALGEANQPFFSTWPDAGPTDFPEPITFMCSLRQLRDLGVSLKDSLQSDIDNKINHTSELKFSIVDDLIATLRDHFPDIKITRGNYDKAVKRQIGTVPAFVDRAFLEITGLREKHDKSLQIIVKHIRKGEASR